MISIKNYPHVQEALFDAERLVKNNLPPTKQEQGGAVVHHVHDHFYWGPGYYPSGCSYESSCSKRDGNNGFGVLGVVSAIVALTMVYFVGSNVADCMHVRSSLKDLDIQQKAVNTELAERSELPLLGMSNVFAKEKDLFNYIDVQAKQSLALKTVLLSSSTITCIGSVVQSVALVQMGIVGAVISAGALLYRYNYGSQNALIEKYVSQLQSAVSEVRNAIYESNFLTIAHKN